MTETDLQNSIRLALSEKNIIFRANVGLFYTKDGRMINSGLPKGFSDLFGFRKKDGKLFFLEIKTKTGKLRKEQKHFLEEMKKYNVIAGVARSIEDAERIINED